MNFQGIERLLSRTKGLFLVRASTLPVVLSSHVTLFRIDTVSVHFLVIFLDKGPERRSLSSSLSSALLCSSIPEVSLKNDSPVLGDRAYEFLVLLLALPLMSQEQQHLRIVQ